VGRVSTLPNPLSRREVRPELSQRVPLPPGLRNLQHRERNLQQRRLQGRLGGDLLQYRTAQSGESPKTTKHRPHEHHPDVGGVERLGGPREGTSKKLHPAGEFQDQTDDGWIVVRDAPMPSNALCPAGGQPKGLAPTG
jgi:hypothetical protein